MTGIRASQKENHLIRTLKNLRYVVEKRPNAVFMIAKRFVSSENHKSALRLEKTFETNHIMSKQS